MSDAAKKKAGRGECVHGRSVCVCVSVCCMCALVMDDGVVGYDSSILTAGRLQRDRGDVGE